MKTNIKTKIALFMLFACTTNLSFAAEVEAASLAAGHHDGTSGHVNTSGEGSQPTTPNGAVIAHEGQNKLLNFPRLNRDGTVTTDYDNNTINRKKTGGIDSKTSSISFDLGDQNDEEEDEDSVNSLEENQMRTELQAPFETKQPTLTARIRQRIRDMWNRFFGKNPNATAAQEAKEEKEIEKQEEKENPTMTEEQKAAMKVTIEKVLQQKLQKQKLQALTESSGTESSGTESSLFDGVDNPTATTDIFSTDKKKAYLFADKQIFEDDKVPTATKDGVTPTTDKTPTATKKTFERTEAPKMTKELQKEITNKAKEIREDRKENKEATDHLLTMLEEQKESEPSPANSSKKTTEASQAPVEQTDGQSDDKTPPTATSSEEAKALSGDSDETKVSNPELVDVSLTNDQQIPSPTLRQKLTEAATAVHETLKAKVQPVIDIATAKLTDLQESASEYVSDKKEDFQVAAKQTSDAIDSTREALSNTKDTVSQKLQSLRSGNGTSTSGPKYNFTGKDEAE